MKDKRSLHLKVQELCDCYATTDPLKEMSIVKDDKDKDEAGLKWLALAALHGINGNAKKISFARLKDGTAKVTAEYHKSELPSPGPEVGDKIIEAVRGITHLEGEKAKSALALGIRESSIEVNIKMKRSEDGEKVTLEFPK
jgi:hypothetical protein